MTPLEEKFFQTLIKYPLFEEHFKAGKECAKITIEFALKILRDAYEPMDYAPTIDNAIDELEEQLSKLTTNAK